MNMNTPQILKVENLKVVFDSAKGYITAVKDVNFALRKGEILALVGESGRGKQYCVKVSWGFCREMHYVPELRVKVCATL